jgi:hypothetical protein
MKHPYLLEMKEKILFACLMSLITTLLISFTLVSINVGFTERFLFTWLRSWGIAFIIAALSILFIAPVIAKLLNERKNEKK